MLIKRVSKPKCSDCLLIDNFSLAAISLAMCQNTMAAFKKKSDKHIIIQLKLLKVLLDKSRAESKPIFATAFVKDDVCLNNGTSWHPKEAVT